MWIFAYSEYVKGEKEPVDSWSVHSTKAEAKEAHKKVKNRDLHCWAIAEIKSGSEPHYVD